MAQQGGGRSAGADALDRAFEADTVASRAATPWTTLAPPPDAPAGDAELYCVATWARGSLTSAPRFAASTIGVKAELDAGAGSPGGALGYSLSVSLAAPFGYTAETVTVWRERAHTAAFFRGGAHAAAMAALQGALHFRSRRVWVRAADLPQHGASAAAFWTAIKSGRFRNADALS
jgi:hypothetical protein